MNIKRIKTFLACCLVCCGFAAVLAACSDDKEGMGTPVITGVRTCYPDKADSLFTKASPGQTIAIIGENLASALKVYINDPETYSQHHRHRAYGGQRLQADRLQQRPEGRNPRGDHPWHRHLQL